MIKSFRHAGLERFYRTGSKAGIQPAHAKRLRLQLTVLDQAEMPADLDYAGWALHKLRGSLAGQYAISVNGNWRLVFAFEGEDIVLLDYLDDH